MAGFEVSRKPLPSTAVNIDYSTLEVDYNRCPESKDGPVSRPNQGSEKFTHYSDAGKEAVVIQTEAPQHELLPPTDKRKFLGLKPKTAVIVFPILLLVLLAAVGGGIGGHIAARNKTHGVAPSISSQIPTPIPIPTPTRKMYTNTGLAAMQWTDLDGVLHKRLYYQDNQNRVRESSWDNSSAFDSAWQINTISDVVKASTPIAAAAGYPHTDYNYSVVKNVYYMSSNNQIFERQASSNASQLWKDDNFSGLYTGSNSTFMTAYWNQNIQNKSQELVVLFQQDSFANGITQGRYTSNSTTSNPWVTNNFGFSQPKGSTFGMSLVSYRSGKHLMLYTVDDGKNLQQHEYTISDTDLDPRTIVSLTSQSATGLVVEPRSPLAIVAQDNQPLYASGSLPQCTQNTPLTNLILFAVSDRSSLVMSMWNCSTGFVDATSEISPLQKVNTTYLSLAAMSDKTTGDGSLFIMFDSGDGPKVEEWTVPKRAGMAWSTSRNITVDFNL